MFCFLIALRLMHDYIIRYHKEVIYGKSDSWDYKINLLL